MLINVMDNNVMLFQRLFNETVNQINQATNNSTTEFCYELNCPHDTGGPPIYQQQTQQQTQQQQKQKQLQHKEKNFINISISNSFTSGSKSNILPITRKSLGNYQIVHDVLICVDGKS